MFLERNKGKILIISAFFAPLVIFIFSMLVNGYYFTGNNSLSLQDMTNQYLSFFAEQRRSLLSRDITEYSFSKTLGGNSASLILYYLSSPLNLLVVFFPYDKLLYFVLFISVIKIALSGLTMALFLKSLNKDYDLFATIFFSICYALSGYVIVYLSNLMWLDAVILLPLILRSVNKFFKTLAIDLFFVLYTFLALVSNYYIGYMVCIFTTLYFISQLIILNGKEDKKKIIKLCIKFAIQMLLSISISAFALLPAFLSLMGGKGGFELYMLKPLISFDKSLLLSFLGLNFTSGDFLGGSAKIFSATLVFLLGITYFIKSKSSVKEKIVYLVFALGMFFSSTISITNLIWHGMSYPAGFMARFSFASVFLFILLASKGYDELQEGCSKKTKNILICGVAGFTLFLSFVTLAFSTSKTIYKYLGIVILVVTATLLILSFIDKKKEFLKRALLVVACLEIICTTIYVPSVFKSQTLSTKVYEKEQVKTQKIVNMIEKNDDSFYRMEVLNSIVGNPASLYGYYGLSHFSSTEKLDTLSLMDKLGYRNYRRWASYGKGSTAFADSMLSVKYLVSDSALFKKHFTLQTDGEKKVYKNENALSLGYMLSSSVKRVDGAQQDLFKLQNDILSSVYSGQVYEKQEFTKTLVDIVGDGNEKVEKYTQLSSGGKIVFSSVATTTDTLYAYFTADELNGKFLECDVQVNGEFLQNYFTISNYGIISLGEFEAGEEIKIEIIPKTNECYLGECYFYTENYTEFENAIGKIKENEFKLTSFKEDKIVGKVNATQDKDLLFLSIPLTEKGFTVKVDGKTVKPTKVLDGFMGITLSEGEHKIVIEYSTYGFNVGLTITVIGLVSACSVLTMHKRKEVNHKNQNALQ